ncbi:hypothetical protein Tco_0956195 [Tanacetum coccineum]|uniref:MAK10-like protein n=1 Tax=Tanacetum coccineum TaxID=301880 RepID=A0ABQ5E9D6_9ASTR
MEKSPKPYRFQPNGSFLNRSFNNNQQSFNNQSNLEGLVSNFMASQDARLSKSEADFKQQQGEMTNKIDIILKAITDRIMGALPSDTVKNPKLNFNPTSPQPNKSYDDKSEEEERGEKSNSENIDTTPPLPPDPSISFITEKFRTLNSKYDDSREELREDENAARRGLEVEYFDTFPTRSKLAYHKYLMCGPIPSLFLRNPIIIEGCQSNLKIPYNIGHVHVEKACIDLNSPLNIMTRMMYNWIRRRKLEPREDPSRGVSNFTGRITVMHVFIGNFTYVLDLMIFEDISSIIDPRLSQVVIGKPFIEISNMTHDLSLGVVKFIDGINEISYKMPHKIEEYDLLLDLEKEHTKWVYLRNEEDKRRGVKYVMNKILVFYKECLELGPEYLTGVADERGVT